MNQSFPRISLAWQTALTSRTGHRRHVLTNLAPPQPLRRHAPGRREKALTCPV